jgi:hypothetical protein
MTVEERKVKRNKTTKEERNAVEEKQTLRRVPRGVGRPKRFTPTKLRNRINDYFAWCEKQMTYPNIKGMMLHLGMSRDQWYQYEKYPEMRPILDWARDAMEAWSMNDLWKTQSSNTNKQLVAKVSHGWQEERTITHINMSKEQALAKLEAFAPMLLELLKNQMLVNQLGTQQKQIEALDCEVICYPSGVRNE